MNLYYATIRVSATGVANSPLDFHVVLNVFGPDARPKPQPTPVGLLFTAVAGSASPPPQTVFLPTSAAGVISFQASTSTSDGGSWLSVSPQTGAISSTDTGLTSVAANTAGLAPGIYRGTVAYAYRFFGLRTVTVTLVVQPAAVPQTTAQSAGLSAQGQPRRAPIRYARMRANGNLSRYKRVFGRISHHRLHGQHRYSFSCSMIAPKRL